MEDDIIQGRCSAIIQQIVCAGAPQQAPNQKRLLTAAAEALRHQAMLMYRLCRARKEKLSDDQTEDAAYCVLASVASLQPALWAKLTDWAHLLRPKQPVLRFLSPIPMIVKLKEVLHFIARTAHLQVGSSTTALNLALSKSPVERPAAASVPEGAAVVTGQRSEPTRDSTTNHGSYRKRGREEKTKTHETTLGPQLALQVAFAYFRLTVPNAKKLQAVIVTRESEDDGTKLVAQLEDTLMMRGCPISHHLSSGNGTTSTSSGVHAHPNLLKLGDDADDEENFDAPSTLLPLAYPASLGSLVSPRNTNGVETTPIFASPISLPALADAIDTTRSALYYSRLQRCLRNPLLFSPLECASVEGGILPTGAATSLDSRFFPVSFSGSLDGNSTMLFSSPAHFLHPARACPQSLLPLPPQMVTAEYLWKRLLVAGLWLLSASGDPASAIDSRVLHYCCRVVKAASRGDVVCLVCDDLVRERPTLYISALARPTGGTVGGVQGEKDHRSWEEMKCMPVEKTPPGEAAHGGGPLACEVLRVLSKELHEKSYELVARGTVGQCNTSGTLGLAAGAQNSGGGAESCIGRTNPTLPTLRELVDEVRSTYPVEACRAALIGGMDGEAAMRCLLLRCGDVNEDDALSYPCCPHNTQETAGAYGCATASLNVDGLLSVVPYVPRLRETDGVLECAGCFLLFHQSCVCPTQRDIAGGCFLCHNCRLRRTGQFRLDQPVA